MWARVYFYSRKFNFRLTVAEGHGKLGESESNLWSFYLWIYKENYLLRSATAGNFVLIKMCAFCFKIRSFHDQHFVFHELIQNTFIAVSGCMKTLMQGKGKNMTFYGLITIKDKEIFVGVYVCNTI